MATPPSIVPRPQYVLALFGAGLSAPSGLPTYAGREKWQGEPYEAFAGTAAFKSDPAKSWSFHEHFRQLTLAVQPNAAHAALAHYAKRNPDFLSISQNIDGLSERAGHPPAQLAPVHGSLHYVKCSLETCSFTAPATHKGVIPNFGPDDFHPGKRDLITLPSCPKCTQGLLRPAVVWKGELLAPGTFEQVEQWMERVPRIDTMLVIGSSGGLSSHYIEDARARGAVVVHFNIARDNDIMEEGDWFMAGDAAQTVPWYIANFLDV